MKSITRVFLWGSLVLAVVLAGCVANPSRDGAAAAESGDYASAISALRPGAEQGDAESQWRLGAAYANAEPPLKDLAEAERWTRKAADQGYVPAMVDMAQLNLFYKPEKDEKAAADWYQKAADRGHPEAQFWMGMFHYSGDGGVAKDYTAAYMWWTLAAARNHPLAAAMLEKSRDTITPAQIDEARRLAQAWQPVK